MDRRMLNIVWMMSMRVGGEWVDLAKSEGLRGGDDGAGGEGRKEGRANWEADEQAVNTLAERLHGIQKTEGEGRRKGSVRGEGGGTIDRQIEPI